MTTRYRGDYTKYRDKIRAPTIGAAITNSGDVAMVTVNITPAANDNPYIRPVERLELPTLVGNIDFVGILQIHNNINEWSTLLCNTVGDVDYTVTWGDGITTTHASGTLAEHKYTFTSVPNMLTNGFKQAIVTVMSANGITKINLAKLPSANPNMKYSHNWLEVKLLTSQTTAASIFGNEMINGIQHTEPMLLESIEWSTDSVCLLDCTQLLYRFYALKRLVLHDNIRPTNMTSMFDTCSALKSAPAINTSEVTNATSAFSGCVALEYVPNYKMPKVTTTLQMFNNCSNLKYLELETSDLLINTSYMFNGCSSLSTVGLFNTSKVYNLTSMFYGCNILTSLPAFDFSKGTTTTNMFYGCYSLTDLPVLDLSSCTDASSMFTSCISLKSIPVINTGNVINFSYFARSCSSLEKVVNLNLASANNATGLFYSCSSLEEVSLVSTTSLTNIVSMFNSCYKLRSIVGLNTVNVTTATDVFVDCISLTKIPPMNLSKSLNVSNFMTVGGTHTGSIRELTGVIFNPIYGAGNILPKTVTSGMISRITLPGILSGISLRNQKLGNVAINELIDSLTMNPNALHSLDIRGNVFTGVTTAIKPTSKNWYIVNDIGPAINGTPIALFVGGSGATAKVSTRIDSNGAIIGSEVGFSVTIDTGAGAGHGGYGMFYYTDSVTGYVELFSYLGVKSEYSTSLSPSSYSLAGVGLGNLGVFYGGNLSVVINTVVRIDGTGTLVGTKNSIGTARRSLAGAGIGSLGIYYGGYTSAYVNTVTRIDGTGVMVGTESNVGSARAYLAGAGIGSICIYYGGIGSNGITNKVTRIDGTGAIVGSNSNVGTARQSLAGAGVGSIGVYYSGNNSSGTSINTVTRIDGNGVKVGTESSVGTARQSLAGAGLV
jgi:hypothetical protein